MRTHSFCNRLTIATTDEKKNCYISKAASMGKMENLYGKNKYTHIHIITILVKVVRIYHSSSSTSNTATTTTTNENYHHNYLDDYKTN